MNIGAKLEIFWSIVKEMFSLSTCFEMFNVENIFQAKILLMYCKYQCNSPCNNENE